MEVITLAQHFQISQFVCLQILGIAKVYPTTPCFNQGVRDNSMVKLCAFLRVISVGLYQNQGFSSHSIEYKTYREDVPDLLFS